MNREQAVQAVGKLAGDFVAGQVLPRVDAEIAGIENPMGQAAARAGRDVLAAALPALVGLLTDFAVSALDKLIGQDWPVHVQAGRVERVDERA